MQVLRHKIPYTAFSSGGCSVQQIELRFSIGLLATTDNISSMGQFAAFLFFCLTCFASKVVILETLKQIQLLFPQKERRVKISIWPFVNNYFFCNLSYT